MKALVGAFNQEKALVGAFSVIVQPVVESMEHYTALSATCLGMVNVGDVGDVVLVASCPHGVQGVAGPSAASVTGVSSVATSSCVAVPRGVQSMMITGDKTRL